MNGDDDYIVLVDFTVNLFWWCTMKKAVRRKEKSKLKISNLISFRNKTYVCTQNSSPESSQHLHIHAYCLCVNVVKMPIMYTIGFNVTDCCRAGEKIRLN